MTPLPYRTGGDGPGLGRCSVGRILRPGFPSGSGDASYRQSARLAVLMAPAYPTDEIDDNENQHDDKQQMDQPTKVRHKRAQRPKDKHDDGN